MNANPKKWRLTLPPPPCGQTFEAYPFIQGANVSLATQRISVYPIRKKVLFCILHCNVYIFLNAIYYRYIYRWIMKNYFNSLINYA